MPGGADNEDEQLITITYQHNEGLYKEKEFPKNMSMNRALSTLLLDIGEKGCSIYYT